ncbi:MAG TPA: YkgJ family cysteine cluster protein [Phycisphaerae bacterium]|nr:YkgJ family cysteine cluster protein [Phycisphaerae bacterium]
MSGSLTLHLPGFQRFDCHRCTHCCRDMLVPVTQSEMRRILDSGWSERLPGVTLFHRRGCLADRTHMLAHQPDGACVFLSKDNLCRLHAETGVDIKPLPCRLFPFMPASAIDGLRMDLRCDCPSVAVNKGRSLHVHAQELARLVGQMRLGPRLSAPAWSGRLRLNGREFAAVVEAFVRLLRGKALSPRDRLRAGCLLLDTLYEVRPHKVRGERFVELMALLSEGAETDAASRDSRPPTVPDRLDRLFRQWLFLHMLADDPHLLRAGRLARTRQSWRRYGQSRAFLRGCGTIPRLRDGWPDITFESVMQVRPAPDDALEPVLRFIRVKLDAHAFAGPGYYRHDMIRGLTALLMSPALVGWAARLRAAGAGRGALATDDVIEGLRTTAMTFGLSPLMSRLSERLRLRSLAVPGGPSGLLGRYGP